MPQELNIIHINEQLQKKLLKKKEKLQKKSLVTIYIPT